MWLILFCSRLLRWMCKTRWYLLVLLCQINSNAYCWVINRQFTEKSWSSQNVVFITQKHTISDNPTPTDRLSRHQTNLRSLKTKRSSLQLGGSAPHHSCTVIQQHPTGSVVQQTMTPFPWASTVTNGSAKAESQLSGWRDPFPWTDPSLSGPGSELFTCLSVPPSGGGWQRGGAIPVPGGMGSNGPITAKPDRGDWPWRCPLAVWSSQLKLL